MTAFNTNGPSDPSDPSNEFATASPGFPEDVTFTASATDYDKGTVTWADSPVGGTPAYFEVTCTNVETGAAVGPQQLPAPATSTGIDGFTGFQSMTEYYCTVVAVNDLGSSAPSKPSNADQTRPAYLYALNSPFSGANTIYNCAYSSSSYDSANCLAMQDPAWNDPSNHFVPYALAFSGSRQLAFTGDVACSDNNCAVVCNVAPDGSLTGCVNSNVGLAPIGVAAYGSTVFLSDNPAGKLGVCAPGAGNTLSCVLTTAPAQLNPGAGDIVAISDSYFYTLNIIVNKAGVFGCRVGVASAVTCTSVTQTGTFPAGSCLGQMSIVGDVAIISDNCLGYIYTCDVTQTPWSCGVATSGLTNPSGLVAWKNEGKAAFTSAMTCLVAIAAGVVTKSLVLC